MPTIMYIKILKLEQKKKPQKLKTEKYKWKKST